MGGSSLASEVIANVFRNYLLEQGEIDVDGRIDSFTYHLSKPLEEWETKCIILTPFDRITKELMDAHDENCEFWLLSEKPWFDESLLEITARKNKASDELPNIKISHITVDLPIYK